MRKEETSHSARVNVKECNPLSLIKFSRMMMGGSEKQKITKKGNYYINIVRMEKTLKCVTPKLFLIWLKFSIVFSFRAVHALTALQVG